MKHFDPNKRITEELAREWAAFQEKEQRRRLWVGVRSAFWIAVIIGLAVVMMLFLCGRIS